MTSHTPGPWEFSAFGKLPQLKTAHAIIKAKNAPRIADVRSVYDARLIAAAPDLLVALERAATIIANGGRYNGNDIDLIEGAIAKARGK